MVNHSILGGSVQLYRRGDGRTWHCSASVEGKQRRATTKEQDLSLAKQAAEDWYLGLRGKARAGELLSERTFATAATQFLKEYAAITEGDRSVRWTEGHEIRLRVHLLPFFGKLGLSQITPGRVQDYRVHRMGSRDSVNPHSRSNRPPSGRPPARSTLHNEIVTLRQVLKTAYRHGWLDHLPDLSPPYRTQGKVVHRPWFSPAEYKQLYEASRKHAKAPPHPHYTWAAEQLHDFILFMANTGLRPDEANNLEHRDVEIVEDEATEERILEIEVRGKRGIGFCKSMAGAVRPYERLLGRAKPVKPESRREGQARRRAGLPEPELLEPIYPEPTDKVFPGNQIVMFNGLLDRANLKLDRDGKPRTAYSLRHTYICMRLMEGADIYQIAKNCRTSVEMIEKFYAAHIKTMLDASAINVRRVKRVSARQDAQADDAAEL